MGGGALGRAALTGAAVNADRASGSWAARSTRSTSGISRSPRRPARPSSSIACCSSRRVSRRTSWPGAVTPVEDRVAMVELAIADNPRSSSEPIEVDRAGPSYTVDTVEAAGAPDPGDAHRDPVGRDVRRAADLARAGAPVRSGPRGGRAPRGLPCAGPGVARPRRFPAARIGSTTSRGRASGCRRRRSAPVSPPVDRSATSSRPAVEAYIAANQLYRTGRSERRTAAT